MLLASVVLFLVYPLVQRPTKQPPVQAQPGCIVMIQSTGIFGRISYPGFDRDVRTWEYGALFLYDFVFGIVFLSVWVLLVGAQCLVRRWLRVLQQCLNFGWVAQFLNFAVDANPEVFGLRSHAEWRGVPNRCFSFSPGCAARTSKT